MLIKMLVRKYWISKDEASCIFESDAALIDGSLALWPRAAARRAHFRARVHRTRTSAFLRLYEAEVKRCERSQRADKTVLYLVVCFCHCGSLHGKGESPHVASPFFPRVLFSATRVLLSHPSLARDNGIHLSEEKFLKRYLKRRLLPNGRVLWRTEC